MTLQTPRIKLPAASKIVTVHEVQAKLKTSASLKTVFTNGCFDLLHRGHVTYLEEAAKLGDFLIVGLNTDASVKSLGKDRKDGMDRKDKKAQGPKRPIQDQDSRALVLASLESVDLVVLFDEPTPLRLIELIAPHILVKGSDYQPDQIVGAQEVVRLGGQVKTIQLVEGFGTTHIINKILQDRI